MRAKIFDDGDIRIFDDNGKFFVRYDAGSHQIVIREDEVSELDALEIMAGTDRASKVLFELQKTLLAAGINPYVSNV